MADRDLSDCGSGLKAGTNSENYSKKQQENPVKCEIVQKNMYKPEQNKEK